MNIFRLMKNIIKDNGFYCILLSILLLSKILGFINPAPNSIFVCVYIFLIISFVKKINVKISFLPFILYFYIPFSILFASPHEVFSSWSRFVFFLLLSLVVSPILINYLTNILSVQILGFINLDIVY